MIVGNVYIIKRNVIDHLNNLPDMAFEIIYFVLVVFVYNKIWFHHVKRKYQVSRSWSFSLWSREINYEGWIQSKVIGVNNRIESSRCCQSVYNICQFYCLINVLYLLSCAESSFMMSILKNSLETFVRCSNLLVGSGIIN